MKTLLSQLFILLCLTLVSMDSLLAKTITEQLLDVEQSPQKSLPYILPHQAKALKQMVPSDNVIKTIEVKLTKLTDNQGLVYLGGVVNKAIVAVYLNQMKARLNEQYTSFRQNQMIRDHNEFHVTFINPYEYQKINKKDLIENQTFTVSLHGLGRVKKGDDETYFVVASSDQGQRFRETFLLDKKDFHVTLGFNPNDIYTERKNLDTLLK
ncbi:hypothetical protein ACOYR1_07255 [Thalassotalea piscium]